MGLGKTHLPANLEVAILVVSEILKGNLKFWGAPLGHGHAHFLSMWDFMMRLRKPQRFANFEGAGFICYENITFVFKNWGKPKWGNPLLFGETDFTVGFADPMFAIRCATVVELQLQEMGDFYEKPHFTMESFKFREAVKWELKIFAPNYQKPNLVEQIVWHM